MSRGTYQPGAINRVFLARTRQGQCCCECNNCSIHPLSSQVTNEDRMRSTLLPTSLLLILQAVALQAVMSDPVAAASRKVDNARNARTHRPAHRADRRPRFRGSGLASFYWQPQKLASGGTFNPRAMTAAHRTLPIGTRVRVTHAGNGRSVDVRINDRGPFTADRIIDLSKAAAELIGMTAQGITRVKITVLGQ
jgi:rare lipoprotein A (peptidoglycan hydrolase)